MKRKISFYIFFLAFLASCSSTKSLTSEVYEIEYEKSTILNDSIFNIIYKNVPKENKDLNYQRFTRKQLYKLTIKNEKSIFTDIPTLTNRNIKNEANGVKYFDGSSKLYRNILTQNYIIANNRDKDLLIQDALKVFDWDLSYNDEKEILGYKVKKATAIGLEADTSVVAWYAPNLENFHGPHLYWGLPGLILKIEIDFYGEHNNFIEASFFTATKIKMSQIKEELEPDKKNKKVLTYKQWQSYIQEQNEKYIEFHSQGVDTTD